MGPQIPPKNYKNQKPSSLTKETFLFLTSDSVFQQEPRPCISFLPTSLVHTKHLCSYQIWYIHSFDVEGNNKIIVFPLTSSNCALLLLGSQGTDWKDLLSCSLTNFNQLEDYFVSVSKACDWLYICCHWKCMRAQLGAIALGSIKFLLLGHIRKSHVFQW